MIILDSLPTFCTGIFYFLKCRAHDGCEQLALLRNAGIPGYVVDRYVVDVYLQDETPYALSSNHLF